MAPCFGWDIKNYQQTLLLHLGSSTKMASSFVWLPEDATQVCLILMKLILMSCSPLTVHSSPKAMISSSKNPINEHDKYQIISNLKQMNRAIAISNEHMIVTNGTAPDLEQYFAFGSEKLKIADNFDEISRTDIYQIMCSCKKDEHSQILSGAPHSQITAWWDKAVDIIPLNSGKGNAVAAVLRHYGFSKDEAIAFGDGHNDIEMLEAVGIGVAMGNAKDEVKAKADFVCQSVENDGIYHYCVENKLIF